MFRVLVFPIKAVLSFPLSVLLFLTAYRIPTKVLLSNPPSAFIFVFCSRLPKLELQLKSFSGRDTYSACASATPQLCYSPLPVRSSDNKCFTAPCFCCGGYTEDFKSWKHNSVQLNLRRQALWLGVKISHIPFGLSLGKDHSTKRLLDYTETALTSVSYAMLNSSEHCVKT